MMSSPYFVFEGNPTSIFGERFAGTTIALRRWLPDFVRDDVLRMRIVRVVDWYGQKLWQQGVCVDGKERGVWTHWYENGKKVWQGVYVEGKRHGEWTYWHANGQKSSQGAYVDGKLHGDHTWWRSSGQKQWQGVYVDGKEHGEWIYYNENGDVFRRDQWEHGRRLLVTTTTTAP